MGAGGTDSADADLVCEHLECLKLLVREAVIAAEDYRSDDRVGAGEGTGVIDDLGLDGRERPVFLHAGL